MPVWRGDLAYVLTSTPCGQLLSEKTVMVRVVMCKFPPVTSMKKEQLLNQNQTGQGHVQVPPGSCNSFNKSHHSIKSSSDVRKGWRLFK